MPIRFLNRLAVLLVAGTALHFSGCGNANAPPEPPSPAAKTPATAPAASGKDVGVPAKPAAPVESIRDSTAKNDGGGPVLTPPATTSGESKSDSK